MEREKPRLTPAQRLRVLLGCLEDECRAALDRLVGRHRDVAVGLLEQVERMRERIIGIGGDIDRDRSQ